MPTASSARLSAATAGPSSLPSSAKISRQRSATKVPARPPARSKNKGDPSTRPPLSTSEILEKATVSLTGISTRDALTVWKALGLYLGEQLQLRRRVVSVDRFGVFGCNDAGEAVFLHSPVFIQSNRLKETYSQPLKGQPALTANAEPMSKINTLEIGQEYLQNCGREIVEQVVAHVIAFIGKVAKQGRAMFMSFQPLGEWTCSGEKAEFRFTPEFQREMVKSVVTRKAPSKPKSKSPEEMRGRGQGDCVESSQPEEQLELTLTSQTLVQHTAKEAEAPKLVKSSQGASQKAGKSLSSKQSGSKSRVAWSESDASQGREKPPSRSPQETSRSRSVLTPVGIIGRVQARLMERCGEGGLNALQRVLSLFDTSGDGCLSSQELKFGLRDLGIELSPSELRQVVEHFDRNGDGVVSLDELLLTLRGGDLSQPRHYLIERAFRCMDKNHQGVVSLDDLRDNYDVSLLPRVRAGKKTKAQAMTEFLREWEPSVEHNNGISWQAFLDYYHNLSACMPDDSDFELLMRQTWHVAAPESEPESDGDNEHARMHQTSAPKELNTEETPPKVGASTQSKEWDCLRSVLLPQRIGVHTQPTLDDICRRLGVNRVWGDGNETMNTRAFANALTRLDRQLQSKEAQSLAQLVVQRCGSGGGDMISLGMVFQQLTRPQTIQSGMLLTTGTKTTISSVIDRIRARLLQRLQATESDGSGSTVPTFLGLNALQRTLRLLDSNGDKRLSKDELKSGLQKIGVQINFSELDQLFTTLDADRSGCIDTDEFLVAMRGVDGSLAKNSRRLALVHQAFDLLDRDRDGRVTLQELSAAYDTSKHPEVLAGRMTAQEAVRQFAQQWDTQEKDGVITRQEFELYYRNVSAVVDRDDYFELMMRNAWHISGGDGQCANTSNRRALVTHTDGSQSVQEVKNDLGIRASDTVKIKENLRAQGVIAKEVATAGFVESKKRDTAIDTRSRYRDGQCETTRTGSSRSIRSLSSSSGASAKRQGADQTPKALVPSSFFAHADVASVPHDRLRKHRIEQRQLRERAALLIQSHFRGFKSRKFAECVRRQMAAEALRKQQRDDEDHAQRKRVIPRAALKSYYGF